MLCKLAEALLVYLKAKIGAASRVVRPALLADKKCELAGDAPCF